MVTKFAYELKQFVYVNKKHFRKRIANIFFESTLFKSLYSQAN